MGPPNGYPSSDGRPMAESDHHRDLMCDLIETLETYYADDPMVYVSGNLLVFYVPGNRRKYVAPDVFVVKGVAKRKRRNYLLWEEGKGPDMVIEVTSSRTRREDLKTKFSLYQDTLRVPELFLFDPMQDYLDPPLQGYRLREGKYTALRAVRGRLPSRVLGLHLERNGSDLRMFHPGTERWLPTVSERIAEAEQKRRQMEAETQRLRRHTERLRRDTARLRRETKELLRRLGK
jgi:Uma2 family endonuclease